MVKQFIVARTDTLKIEMQTKYLSFYMHMLQSSFIKLIYKSMIITFKIRNDFCEIT